MARARTQASPARDGFLDAVRAIAVVRVVTWHTYGWAPITWVVAAVPAMFFVSGHLLARSFARRPARIVVADRLRRLLIPYWLFGLVAWLVMVGARRLEHTPETASAVAEPHLVGRSVQRSARLGVGGRMAVPAAVVRPLSALVAGLVAVALPSGPTVAPVARGVPGGRDARARSGLPPGHLARRSRSERAVAHR